VKILHADTDDLDNPLAGGQPVRTYEVNRRLAANNHDITVLTATYSGAIRRLEKDGVAYRRIGFRLPCSGLSPHLSFLMALGPTIKSIKHDLIVEEFTPPVGFCALPLWTRKPVISIVQWYFFKDWEKRYKLPFESIMRFLAGRGYYKYFIVQTEAMATHFRNLMPASQIWVVPCGLDRRYFQFDHSMANTGEYVLFLGRLDINHKGLDWLLDTWQELQRVGCAPPLIIAGEGQGRQYLEKRIFQEGLCQNIKLVGKVTGEEKLRLLRDCKFLVMPSRQETFGMAALEAMASGKAVIASDIEHLNEVVQSSHGRLVPFGNVQALAATINELNTDFAQCSILGKNAYIQSANYDWDKIAVRQEQIYETVVEMR